MKSILSHSAIAIFAAFIAVCISTRLTDGRSASSPSRQVHVSDPQIPVLLASSTEFLDACYPLKILAEGDAPLKQFQEAKSKVTDTGVRALSDELENELRNLMGATVSALTDEKYDLEHNEHRHYEIDKQFTLQRAESVAKILHLRSEIAAK
jgi:hypothetical protein